MRCAMCGPRRAPLRYFLKLYIFEKLKDCELCALFRGLVRRMDDGIQRLVVFQVSSKL